jgi:hypothetical protein
VLVLALAGPAAAGSLAERFCGRAPPLSAAQQDRLLRIAALVKDELEAGCGVAIVARSGLDLSRFGLRYSHAGLSLADGAGPRWAVRQLYFDCDEARPRLFDQGLTGFVAGSDDPERGFVSILRLPPDVARPLRTAALDRPRALRLLAGTYAANAHAWSMESLNCNQWLVELLAAAAAELPDGPDLRQRAQAWLREAGYRPRGVDAGSHWLLFAAGFVPWLRLDDRPDPHSLRFEVSVPEAIEPFVRARWPQAERVELCHAGARVVLRRDGPPIAEGCIAAPGDREILL